MSAAADAAVARLMAKGQTLTRSKIAEAFDDFAAEMERKRLRNERERAARANRPAVAETTRWPPFKAGALPPPKAYQLPVRHHGPIHAYPVFTHENYS